MSAVVIAGDTSGSVTLNAPAVAGTTTLTLPTTSGTVLTTASADTVNSLNAGIGVNQTWQAPTRAIGTTYTNSTGKPILVVVSYTMNAAGAVQGLTINGTGVYAGAVNVTNQAGGFALIVPNGATYVTLTNSGTMSLVAWSELR